MKDTSNPSVRESVNLNSMVADVYLVPCSLASYFDRMLLKTFITILSKKSCLSRAHSLAW